MALLWTVCSTADDIMGKKTPNQEKGFSNAKSVNAGSGLLLLSTPSKNTYCKCHYETTDNVTASSPIEAPQSTFMRPVRTGTEVCG